MFISFHGNPSYSIVIPLEAAYSGNNFFQKTPFISPLSIHRILPPVVGNGFSGSGILYSPANSFEGIDPADIIAPAARAPFITVRLEIFNSFFFFINSSLFAFYLT